jgi:proline iminopeptidase
MKAPSSAGLRVRDTELYVDVEGAGLVPEGPRMRERPVALVIHGGPGSDHSGFKPAFSPLADTMQLVYFDHRGQGRSARGDVARHTLDENVEDMEALRVQLGLGPVVSIGTSYGGMVAMAHAARYPGVVAQLVLIVTAAHSGFNARAREIVAERGTVEQQAVCAQLWAGELRTEEQLRHYYDDVMGPLYTLRHDPAASAVTRTRGILSPDAINRAFAPGGFLQSFDLRPELPRITAPTLVLAGRHDWICPPEFSQENAGLSPGAELRILEQSSHSMRVDEPEAMLGEIRRFVAGSSARAGRTLAP